MILAQALRNAREQHDYAGLVECVPYANYLGVKIARDDNGLVFHLPFCEKIVGNPALPALHGGVVAGFMENAALLELLVEQAPKRLLKTVDFSIDYARSAKPKDCYATCETVRQGSRVALVQIRCWQTIPEQPIAVARAHFILERLPPTAN